jgi:outer membrane protein TolC
MRKLRRLRSGQALVALLVLLPASAVGQELERVTFEEAIRRAVTSHPTVQQASAGVLRAESILQQVRARSRPAVDATFSTNVIAPVTRFEGASITPRTQTVTTAGLTVPLLTPVAWAERTQAADQVLVSERSADDTRRTIALATGRAYLAIIAQRRVVELNERARDNARAHYDYANQRFEGGLGSRLNALRAQQELSSNEARVEEARLGVRRAQETLGVLVAADRPVDAAADPAFELPPPSVTDAELVRARQDVQVIATRQAAAERVAADTWRTYLPSATALFSPQALVPAGLFANSRSWSASVVFAVPVFDAGQRRGLAREREALVGLVRAERDAAERQGAS